MLHTGMCMTCNPISLDPLAQGYSGCNTAQQISCMHVVYEVSIHTELSLVVPLHIHALFLSQRPQSAAAQLTLSDSVAQEDKQSSEGAWSLPVGKADESKQDGVDGPALSRSVDDMLLAAGGADVETGFVSSHTTGLETLLSQVCTYVTGLYTHMHAYMCTHVCRHIEHSIV